MDKKEFRVDKGKVEIYLLMRRWAEVCFAFNKHFDDIIRTDREWFVGKDGIIFVLPEKAWCKLLFKHNYTDIDAEHKKVLEEFISEEKKYLKNTSSNKGLCQKDLDYIEQKLGYTNRSITKDNDVIDRIGYPTGKKTLE